MAQTIKIKRSSTSGNKLTSSNSVAGELGLNTADKALYIQTGSSNGDVVTVAHESTLKIDESNGRIGIGNTSPSATLEVGTLTSGSTGNVIINSEGGNPPALNVKSRTNRARIQVQDNDTSGYIIAEDSVFSIGFADSLSANNLNITNSYNVGIGTTAPAAPIHVQTVHEIATIIQSSHNNGTHFVIRNSDATTGRKAIINLAPANNVTGAYIGAEAMEDFSTTANRTADLFFSTRKDGTLAERMRIDSSGNVLVGTTASAPQNFSSGSGTQISDGYIAVARGGSLALLNRISTDGDIIEFKKDGSLIGNIGVDGGDMYLRTGITGVIFNDANNAILPYRTNTEDDANIDLGHPSYRFQDFYLSGNIQMGGNLDVVGQIGAYNNPSSSWGTMNFRATDYIFKNSGGTAKMSLDASGRLGINQTPLANNFALQVTGLGGGAGDARAVYLKGSGAHTSIGSTGPTLTLQNTNSTVNNIVKLSFESASSGETVSINAINTNHSSHYGDMAFNTRGSSGYSEKMRIMANGNVGIGTQNPAAKLHISGNSDISDEDCMLIIDDVDGSAGSRIPAIMFRSNTGGTVTNQARIRGTDTQGLKISGSSALGDDLVVQSGGVGIGTSSPDNKLHVYKGDSGHSWSFDGGDGLILENSDSLSINITTPAANSGNILFSDANARGQGRIVYDHSADYMGFMTAGVSNEHVRILSSGKVGIGTTNPIYTLVVSEDGNDNIEIGGGVIQRYNRSSNAYQAMNYYAYSHNFYTTGGGHQSLFIKNDGNVGIGTSTPYAGTNVRSLTVNATSYPALALQIGGNNAGLLMSNSSGTDLYALGNKRLRFITDDTTRIRIAGTGGITFNEEYTFPTSDGSANQVLKTDGSGNLSFVTIAGAGAVTEIEDSDGDTKIQVEESSDEDVIRFDTAGTERARIGVDASSDSTLEIVRSGVPAASGKITFNGSGLITDVTSGYHGLIVRTGGTERARFNANGGLSIGTTTVPPNGGLLVDNDIKGNSRIGVGSGGNLSDAAIYKNSDTNTGIIWPAADTLGFTTGGGERLRIDSSGRVGIGTTGPAGRLDIQENSTGSILTRIWNTNTSGTGESVLRIANSGNNAQGSRLEFTDQSYYVGSISADRTNGIQFGTNATGTTGVATERMRIASNGNVGIGTTAPSYLLHVDAAVSTDPSYIVASSAANFVVAMGSQNSPGIGQEAFVGTLSNDDLKIKSNNTERIRVKADGKVGIGNSSPSAKLTIHDNSTYNGALFRVDDQYNDVIFNGGSAGTDGVWEFKNAGTWAQTRFYVQDANNADDRLTFDFRGSGTTNKILAGTSSGKVGIGTTSPARTLDIVGDFGVKKGSSAIAFNEYSNGATIWLDGSDGDFTGGDYFNISAYGTTDLAFGYGAATKITMKNDGKLGIGITAPASNLHVKTSVDNSVSQGIVVERSLNSDRGYINYSGGAFQFRSTVGDPIVFGETDAEHMRILPDGNVGIGTTTPDEFGIGGSFRILSVGGDATGVINIVDNNTNGSYLQFGNAAGLRRASIHSLDGSNLIFTLNSNNSGTALTERMRIERTGDWMVGNTVSRVASHYGNQAGIGWREADHHFEAATTYNRSAAEFGRNNANSGDVITIRQQGTSVGMIGTEGGDSLVIQSNGSTGSGLRFHPSVASIQPVRQGVTIDATISLGADTRRFKDLHLSASANIGHASIQTDSTTTSATTQVAIDAFAASEFRSAEFTIQVTNSTDSTYHLTKILLIHDGTTPGITEYGTVFTGSAAEATFDADISSGNVRLLATPASTDSMTFKVVRHCITV